MIHRYKDIPCSKIFVSILGYWVQKKTPPLAENLILNARIHTYVTITFIRTFTHIGSGRFREHEQRLEQPGKGSEVLPGRSERYGRPGSYFYHHPQFSITSFL
jgi:hypothetical protein